MMNEKEKKKEILFFNTPISENVQDIIGVKTYVQKISCAIDAGAQMIAITAPFGAGKTSVIELLVKERGIKNEEDIVNKAENNEGIYTKNNRDRKQKLNYKRKTLKRNKIKEKIYKISMWSQLNECENEIKSNDLHRTFIYQLLSQINHKRGTYIRRRLNPNYKILKLHVNKTRYWIVFVLALICLSLFWVINSFGEYLKGILPFLVDFQSTLEIFLLLFGVVLSIVSISTAEIIFSAIKQNSDKREIESTEIIDIYREEILKYASKIDLFNLTNRKIIVVIEDLDRTSDTESVIWFLKELRKYYVPKEEGKKSIYRNQIVFIVNIMPEALLLQGTEWKEKNSDSLYAKIFDYTLNLQTINIDNYDAILEGLLIENREMINKLDIGKEDKLSDIPGMKWIIREKRIGIREIKERLNIAFSLYESLKDKFPHKPIAFEICAVVAYLTTAFEKDFYQTEDRVFKELVELSIQGELTLEQCKIRMPEVSEEYISVVMELIRARLIDNTYRTYFYNYPKGSYLYSSEEIQVMNAILYSDKIEDLEKSAKEVEMTGGNVIEKSFKTLEQLKLPLNRVIFDSETLYINAFKCVRDKVFDYIYNLDYSEDADAKNIKFFSKILSYDSKRKTYNEIYAKRMCEIWESRFSEKALVQLRQMLCKEYAKEILWYGSLFLGVHALIRIDEMNYLPISECSKLINFEHADYNVSIPRHLGQRLENQENITIDELAKMEEVLDRSSDVLKGSELCDIYMDYMIVAGKIVERFEVLVSDIILEPIIPDDEKQLLISKYQQLINSNLDQLTEISLRTISDLIPKERFSLDVGEKLLESGYYLDYILTLILNNENIPFERIEVKEVEKSQRWLGENLEYFSKIREQLCECNEDIIGKYFFMFSDQYPPLNEKELTILQEKRKNSIELMLKYLPAKLVVQDNYRRFIDFFNFKKRNNNDSYDIMVYISNVTSEIAKKMFYELDFDKIRYRHISSERKSEVKKIYMEILNLEKPEEKIKFMKKTKYIDSMWEIELVDKMRQNVELRDGYIEMVNSLDKISKNTINTLCKIGTIYPMSPVINNLLYENKKYVEFIVSQTTGKKIFKMAEGDVRTELWPSYLKIFAGDRYTSTRKYMSENTDFIRLIMHERAYVGYAKENRLQLIGVLQDAESIKNVIEYGTDFALEYYVRMVGFEDKDAAIAFVEIVQQNIKLLESDELYTCIHEKLIDGPLKAKYTNVRKKNGYM